MPHPKTKKSISKCLSPRENAQLDANFSFFPPFFRVPGEIESVRLMKSSLDKWETPKAEFEPHVPASLLKVGVGLKNIRLERF